MSHFAVAILTEGCPTDLEIDKILAPYHEFESTGRDDEYVQTLDKTDHYLKTWQEDTITCYFNQDTGETVIPYVNDAPLYRAPTDEESEAIGEGYGTGVVYRNGKPINYRSDYWSPGVYSKKVFDPSGWGVKEKSFSEVLSFEEYLTSWCEVRKLSLGSAKTDEHKYKYFRVDENGSVFEVIERTNPNSRWDWYVVGGRWAGCLTKTDGSEVNCAKLSEVVPGFSAFAIIKDGVWHERGDMGWWGVVSNGKTKEVWKKEQLDLLNDPEENLWITIVDCHV